ncbi:hypothetical protein Rsub_13432, partial [Raphidocelis subcapitata]
MSHTGIKGNDEADDIATGVASGRRPPDTADCPRSNARESANTGALYFELWAKHEPERHPSSHHFLTQPKAATKPQRRRALQYRYGQLPTGNNLHKWKLTPSPACHMCGAALDNTGHATAGCPALEGLYTERHHAACRLLLGAIEEGQRGGRVMSAD